MTIDDDDTEWLDYIEALEAWGNWLARAAFALPVLVLLALVIKVWLIEPYSFVVIDFDIKLDITPNLPREIMRQNPDGTIRQEI